MKPTCFQPYHEASCEKYYEVAEPAENGKKGDHFGLVEPDALKLIDGIDAVVLRTIKPALSGIQIINVVLKLI